MTLTQTLSESGSTSITQSVSLSFSGSSALTASESVTLAASLSDSNSATGTDSTSVTQSASVTLTETLSETGSTSQTQSASVTLTETLSETGSPSVTASLSYSQTSSKDSASVSATEEATQSKSSTETESLSVSATQTLTDSETSSQTGSPTGSRTLSSTLSESMSASLSFPAPSASVSLSETPTRGSLSPSSSPSLSESGSVNSPTRSQSFTMSVSNGFNKVDEIFIRSIVIPDAQQRGAITLTVRKSDTSSFPTRSAPLANVQLEQAFTGDAFQPVMVGTVNFSVVRPSPELPECFGLQNYISSNGVTVLLPTVASSPPGQRFSSFELFPMRITMMQQSLRNSLCIESKVVAWLVLQSDAVFVTVPRYRYAVFLSYLFFQDGPEAVARILRNDTVVLEWIADMADGARTNVSSALPRISTSSLLLEAIVNASLQNGTNAIDAGSLVTFTAKGESLQLKRNSAPQPESEFLDTAVPHLSNTSVATATTCVISDVASFSRTPVQAWTDLGPRFSFQCSLSSEIAYGVDLQVACASDESCVGYTTHADTTPHCFLRAGQGVDPLMDSPRWLYLKPTAAERRCSTTVSGPGVLSVYIRQTYLTRGITSVFVARGRSGTPVLVARCGGQRGLFAGGVSGRSSACGLWQLCTATPIRPTVDDDEDYATVSVVASSTMAAGGCEAAVGVLFSMRFGEVPNGTAFEDDGAAGSAATQGSGVVTGSTNLSTVVLRTSFPNRFYLRVQSRRFVRVFVHNTRRLLLSVVQTGFDCQGRSCSRPFVNVSAVTVNGTDQSRSVVVLQQCGGSAGFVGNSTGISDQCDKIRFCGTPVSLNPFSQPETVGNGSFLFFQDDVDPSAFYDSPDTFKGVINATPPSAGEMPIGLFSGWVQIDLDMTSILQGAEECRFFQGVLYASSRRNDTDTDELASINGFVLRESPGKFRALLMPLAGTLVTRFFTNKSAANSSREGGEFPPFIRLAADLANSVLSPGDPRDIYLTEALTPAQLQPWASFGCVMDWISTDVAACSIPVPRGANYMTLLVAQTNFAQQTLTVELRASNMTKLQSVECGGALGFSGLFSTSNRCDLFLRCSSGFLQDDAAEVRLIVPAEVGNSKRCAAAFVATADFQFINVTAPRGRCPFSCASDRKCINMTAVCDEVADCRDGADETPCNDWRLLEVGFYIHPGASPFTKVHQTQNYRECRNIAVANMTTMFAITKNQSLCIVYGSSDARNYIMTPTPILEDTSVLLYARKAGAYPRCSSETTCNGNGAVVETAFSGRILCTCTCHDGWTGSSCSQKLTLSTTGPVFVVVRAASTPPSITTQMLEVGLIDAFARDIVSEVSVSCSPYFSHRSGVNEITTAENNGTLYFLTRCDLHSIDAEAIAEFEAGVISAAALKAIRESMETLDVVEIGLSTQPLARQSTCREGASSSESASVCDLGGSVAVKALRVTLGSTSGMRNVSLEIVTESGIETRRRRSQSTIVAACDSSSGLVNNLLPSGCIASTCGVQLGGESVSSVRLITRLDTSSTDSNFVEDPCAAPIDLKVDADIDVPPVASVDVINTVADFSPFFIAGVLFLALSPVLIIAGMMMLKQHKKIMQQQLASRAPTFTSIVPGDASSSASGTPKPSDNSVFNSSPSDEQGKTKTGPLESLVHHACTAREYLSSNRILRHEKWSAVLLVAAVNLLVIGIFLVLYFQNSRGRHSNVEAFFEVYRTGECSDSVTAPLFTRLVRVKASSAMDCVQREAVGDASNSIFASAYCTTNTTSDNSTRSALTVHVKLALSAGECESQPYVAFPAGSCLPISALLKLLSFDTSYIKINCGSAQDVQMRFDYASVASSIPDLETTRPEKVIREEYLPTSIITTSDQGGFRYPVVESRTIFQMTTGKPNRFNAIRSARELFGPISSTRFLFQHPLETFLDPGTDLVETTAIERSVKIDNISNAQLRYSPRDADLPVGFVYNNFMGVNELSGMQAGAGASRYYAISNTPADIGRFIRSSAVDGTGFTISMYLRASRATLGYAFAVADAREDATGSSPILARVLRMIANGSPPSDWYDLVYTLYSSLLIDGPGGVIRFVFADAPRDEYGDVVSADATKMPIVSAVWDMSMLGLMRLFNGAWHHVVIIIRNENRQIKAQLVLDGQTSESILGWNQCLPRAPRPVQYLDDSVDFPIYGENERIMKSGVLFTGYLNGAVAHLEFSDQRQDLYALWRGTTEAIQTHNTINAVGFITVGSISLAAGVAMLVLMCATSGKEIWEQQQIKATEETARCKKLYNDMWKKKPRDAKKEPYAIVPFHHALLWMDLSESMMIVVLEQLRYNYKDPAQQLVRLMHAIAAAEDPREPDLSNEDLPSSGEWFALVEHAEEQFGDGGDEAGSELAMSTATSQRGGSNNRRNPLILSMKRSPPTVTPDQQPVSGGRGPPRRIQVEFEEESEYTFSGRQAAIDVNETWSPDDLSPDESAILEQSIAVAAEKSATFTPRLSRKRTNDLQGPKKKEKKEEKNKDERGEGADMQAANLDAGGSAQKSQGADNNVQNRMVPSFSGSGDNAQSSSNGGGAESSGGEGSSSDLGSNLTEMFLSMTFVLQGVSVWFASVELPRSYFNAFSTSFSLVAADFTTLVQTSSLTTPLVQLFLVGVIFAAIFYFVEEDEQAFLLAVMRYAWRRDELFEARVKRETTKNAALVGSLLTFEPLTISPRQSNISENTSAPVTPLSHQKTILKGAVDYFSIPPDMSREHFFGEVASNGMYFNVPLLPLSQAKKLDVFVGKVKSLVAKRKGESLLEHGAIAIQDLAQRQYLIQKSLAISDEKTRNMLRYLIVKSKDVATTGLRELGHTCPYHEGRELGAQIQSDVWPFAVRPSCCAQINGTRCNVSVGQMFVCGCVAEEEAEDAKKNGKKSSPLDDTAPHEKTQCCYALCQRHFAAPLHSQLMAPLRALYRKAMRHGSAWIIVSISFALANIAYTPTLKSALLIAACDPYYQCDFNKCWTEPERYFVLASFLCVSVIVGYGIGYPLGVFALLRRRRAFLEVIFFAEEYGDRYKSRDAEGNVGDSVSIHEWRRFVSTDETVLGKLYQSYEMDWMYVTPIMVFWKAAMLVPVVFIERKTFSQLVGIVAVQFLYSAFIFITEPSISPIVDLMLKLGAAHQMILLGILGLDVNQRYRGGAQLDLVALCVTLTYLVLAGLCMIFSTVLPVFSRLLEKRQAAKLLQQMGMQYSETTGMYVVPAKEPIYVVIDRSKKEDLTGEAAHKQLQNAIRKTIHKKMASTILGAALANKKEASLVASQSISPQPETQVLAFGEPTDPHLEDLEHHDETGAQTLSGSRKVDKKSLSAPDQSDDLVTADLKGLSPQLYAALVAAQGWRGQQAVTSIAAAAVRIAHEVTQTRDVEAVWRKAQDQDLALPVLLAAMSRAVEHSSGGGGGGGGVSAETTAAFIPCSAPLVILVTDTPEEAHAVHDTALALLASSDGGTSSSFPYLSDRALFSGSSTLAEDIYRINSGGGASPIVVGTVHRVAGLLRKRVIFADRLILMIWHIASKVMDDDLRERQLQDLVQAVASSSAAGGCQLLLTCTKAQQELTDELAASVLQNRPHPPTVLQL